MNLETFENLISLAVNEFGEYSEVIDIHKENDGTYVLTMMTEKYGRRSIPLLLPEEEFETHIYETKKPKLTLIKLENT